MKKDRGRGGVAAFNSGQVVLTDAVAATACCVCIAH